ncbi:hypothetical protein ABW636_19790 [Aquimarina sp. 2201CG1-2-11]|uniref:hypothetical protein n=1 Tax=Aquimarina discodermiae TaxID=3231043 RepID=UPI003462CFE5
MKNSILKTVLVIALISNIQCFASNTEYKIQPVRIHLTDTTQKKPLHIFLQDSTDTSLIKKEEGLTISIIDFIKNHTDPYKRKYEAKGSWIKSTKWIKDPNWIKKELV